jgi:hypothetical protein
MTGRCAEGKSTDMLKSALDTDAGRSSQHGHQDLKRSVSASRMYDEFGERANSGRTSSCPTSVLSHSLLILYCALYPAETDSGTELASGTGGMESQRVGGVSRRRRR